MFSGILLLKTFWHMVTEMWVNIGCSGNGLVRQQAITWTNVDYALVKSSDIQLRNFSIDTSTTKIAWKLLI